MARISYGQMAKYFHRLATAYTAGIDIRKIVKKETEIGSSAHRLHSRNIYSEIENGESFGRAMMNRDGYFPELAIAVVQAGEKGGRLDDSFKKLAHHYKTLVTFRNNFLQSIAWPCFELLAAVVIIGLLIIVMGIVCRFGNVKEIDWFNMGSTRANFMFYCLMITVIFGSVGTFLYGVMKGWFGLLPMKIARRVPLIGKTIEYLSLSRFAWTMSVAENAGMSPMETAKLSLRATENYYYTQLEEKVCKHLQHGNAFAPVLDATNHFPTDFLIYVENGEMSGELSETMQRASEEYQAQAELNLQTIGKIGFFCTLMFVALLMGFLIITLYKRLYLDRLQEFMV